MTTQQHKVIDKIQKEIDKAYDGVSEYEETLENTNVITDHLYKIEQWIEKLKEMI